MHKYYQLSLLLFITVVLGACSYLPFSGGKLDGNLTESPDDWRNVAQISIIELETNPDEPYSVKLWVVAQKDQKDRLYVFAGDNYSQWAQYIDQNAHVRLKIEDNLYELSATRVADEDEFQQFAQAWLEKYDSDRTDSKASDTYLYRLVTRDSHSA